MSPSRAQYKLKELSRRLLLWRLTVSWHTAFGHNATSHCATVRDGGNQSTFIHWLLCHSCNMAIPHGCSFRKGWMDIMKSLLGIILRSKCKFLGKGVKALRKLLPTWLALMNSSRHLRQIPKWRIASVWLGWLITVLNITRFFFFSLLHTSF